MRSMYAAKGRCFGAIMTVQDGTVCMVLIIIVTAQSYSRCTHARHCTVLYCTTVLVLLVHTGHVRRSRKSLHVLHALHFWPTIRCNTQHSTARHGTA